MEGFLASMGGDSVLNGFKPSGVSYKLAIRLTGKFKTAFPEGLAEDKAEATATNAAAKPAADFLKEAQVDTSVVLIGDSDMLSDDFSLRKQESPFGTMVSQMNANLNLAQNLVEQMAGDSNLIGVRSRATLSRPFTLVKKLEAEAQARGQAKIAELQQSLQETQQRLSELQQQRKDKDQRVITYWDNKIKIATEVMSESKRAFDIDQFNAIHRPELLWSRAKDLIAIGQRNRGIGEMFTIVKTWPDHPENAAWIQKIEDILTGKDTGIDG